LTKATVKGSGGGSVWRAGADVHLGSHGRLEEGVGSSTGEKEKLTKGPMKDDGPKSRDGNAASRKVEIRFKASAKPRTGQITVEQRQSSNTINVI